MPEKSNLPQPVRPLTEVETGQIPHAPSSHTRPMHEEMLRYAWAVLRYKWLLMSAAVLGIVAGMIASRYVHPQYAAHGTVWIETTQREAGNPAPIAHGQLLQSYAWVELLKSYAVMDSVVEQEKLYIRAPSNAVEKALHSLVPLERFRPGTYQVTLEDKKTVALAAATGKAIQRVELGQPVGTPVGFAWVPTADLFRPGRSIEFTLNNPRDVASQLSERLSPSMAEDGRFLRLELTGPEPEQLAATLNAVMRRYVTVAAQLKRAKLNELTKILEEQRIYAEHNLRDSEMALEAFRVRTITLPSAQGSPVSAGLEVTRDPVFANYFDMRVNLENLRRERAALGSILRDAAAGSVAMDMLGTVSAAQSNTALTALLTELNEKRAELRAIEKRYTNEHASVRALRATIMDLERTTIPGSVRALEAQLAAQEQDVLARLSSASTELREIPPRAIEEARLQRRVEIAATLHGVLRQRYEEARLAAVSSIADVQVLDQASVPFAPVTDRRRLIVAGAIFAFVGVALFAILLIDRSDARVRYPEQVTAGMGLSILGVVPHLKGLNGGGQLVDNSQLAEAFRELRFAVLHAHGSAGPVVLSISSSESGDGKSMVATNLASAFANHGHRVLLIDADVRRGSLHRTLRTRRAPGLTDYLLGTRDLAGVTQTTANGVTLIGSGTRMRNAPELLGSVAMTQLIRAMRSQYTAIIIDTPPLSAGVDAYVLAALAGNLVLVVRTGSTDAQFAEAKLALLDRLPIRVLGAVLNDVPPSRAYRYYSYLPGYEAEDEVVLPLAIAGALEQPSDAH